MTDILSSLSRDSAHQVPISTTFLQLQNEIKKGEQGKGFSLAAGILISLLPRALFMCYSTLTNSLFVISLTRDGNGD